MALNRSLFMVAALPFIFALIAWNFITLGRERDAASAARVVLTRLAARHPALAVDGHAPANPESLSQALAGASDAYGRRHTDGSRRLHMVLKSGPETLAIDLARDGHDPRVYWVYPGEWHDEKQPSLAFGNQDGGARRPLALRIRMIE
jgi:hypothetical protein